MTPQNPQENHANKDSVRSRLDDTKEMELRREERASRQMGDLHLNEEGWSKKAKRRIRKRVKHHSAKARRQEDKRLSEWP